jgi:hypothetical protein
MWASSARNEPDQGVDLGERHVVLHEELCELRQDRRELVELGARDAHGRDRVLGPEVHARQDRGEVAAADVVGVLLGHLLDIDAAHVGEDEGGQLADAVVDHPGVVLLRHRRLRAHQHAARHVAADLELEDVAGVRLGLLGGVGELHAAGLHAAAGEHLRLDHHRAADVGRDLLGLLGVRGETAARDRNALAFEDLARLELEEAHLERKTAAGGGHAAGDTSKARPAGAGFSGSSRFPSR